MKCIISFSKKFSKIFSFPKIGVLMRVENKKSHKAIKKNINFYINKETGTVQIYPKVNPKILYNKGHGSGTTGRTWRKHHDEFFYQCRPYLSGKVLEIGGGENSIAINKKLNFKKINFFYSIGKNLNINSKNKKIIKINKFFSKKIFQENKFNEIDLVLHSHLFEHVFNPDDFLNTIYKSMKLGGYHIFSVPNMYKLIKAGMPNAVFFEHPYYYDEKIIEILLKRNGFRIKKKFYFGKQHSIFFVTQKQEKKVYFKYKKFKKNKKLFLNLNKIIENNVKKIYKSHSSGRKIFLFGAHIFSQIILAKIPEKLISGIVDNDINKQNKYLYGTKIKVYPLEILSKILKPNLYLHDGDYEKEIRRKVIAINKKCLII